MDSVLALHRLHFGFTITFHYIFAQLSMGLALLIFVLKTAGLKTGNRQYDAAARFWIRIFAITFAVGVVTGVPMEFQFGTNWSRFSKAAGGVIGQTLAMEGVFAFFLESSFLGLLIFGEKRLGRTAHWLTSLALFIGTWLSGYFIIVTDAWMQHPVAYALDANGNASLTSFWGLLLNPWAGWMYLHNMTGTVVTGGFVMAAIGAFYLLTRRFEDYGRIFVRFGVIAGGIAALLMAFPTGDGQGKMIARHQPVTLAAMEGLFETTQSAPLAIIGQPDTQKKRLDNPATVPGMLSFLTYQRWTAEVKGLDAFHPDTHPDNIPLLYYSYHIMVGLGTIFIAVSAISALLLWKRRLYESRPWLWVVMLLMPFPFIANTAGWMTAELGRQPWLIYGIMRTSEGPSAHVSSGNTLFTLLGFMGMYTVLGILFLFLTRHEIEHGPEAAGVAEPVRGPEQIIH
ncbi:MAG: cytochrome ubiquinol oxidase subunit I [Acidobacteriota bacterium]